MKILAGLAGIGVAKATGALDMGVDAIQGKAGTVGGDAAKAVVDATKDSVTWIKKQFGEMAGWTIAGKDKALIMYKFHDWTFQDGSSGPKELLDHDSGTLFNTINDPLWSTKLDPKKSSVAKPLDTETKTEFQNTLREIYAAAFEKWKTLNPSTNTTDAAFRTYL